MNKESQVRGCHNITFIYTNQGTVYALPCNQTHGRQGSSSTQPTSVGTLGGKDACGPSTQVLTTSCIRAINLSPNQQKKTKKKKKKRKKRLKCQGPGKHTIIYSVTYKNTKIIQHALQVSKSLNCWSWTQKKKGTLSLIHGSCAELEGISWPFQHGALCDLATSVLIL